MGWERKRLGPQTKLRWAWLPGRGGSHPSRVDTERRSQKAGWSQWGEEGLGRTALQEPGPGVPRPHRARAHG